jgi:hypothetical protein
MGVGAELFRTFSAIGAMPSSVIVLLLYIGQ